MDLMFVQQTLRRFKISASRRAFETVSGILVIAEPLCKVFSFALLENFEGIRVSRTTLQNVTPTQSI